MLDMFRIALLLCGAGFFTIGAAVSNPDFMLIGAGYVLLGVLIWGFQKVTRHDD